jgi:ketosteroid isomerase-like protein
MGRTSAVDVRQEALALASFFEAMDSGDKRKRLALASEDIECVIPGSD